MKLIFSALVSFLVCHSAYSATCPESGSVKDYFLSLPIEELEIFDDESGPIKDATSLEKAIAFFDSKNGYIKLQNKTILSQVTASLFKSKDGSKTMAVISDGVSVQNYYAYQCKDGQWGDVKKVFYPVFSLARVADLYRSKKIKLHGKYMSEEDLAKVAHSLYRFRLPKRGKSIEVLATHPDLKSEVVLSTFKTK